MGKMRTIEEFKQEMYAAIAERDRIWADFLVMESITPEARIEFRAALDAGEIAQAAIDCYNMNYHTQFRKILNDI